jgi:NAD(P)-dependent dehydrogenase (short-subunit alcohol dehydrogenase family)
VTTSPPPVIFTASDVALFGEASHDVNPLHTSPEYARRTHFGVPVVHGILAMLACAGRAGPRPRDLRVARIDVEFKNPVFTEVPYEVRVEERGDRSVLRLGDGRRPLLKATIAFEKGPSWDVVAGSAAARSSARKATLEELVPGWACRGQYGAEPSALRALQQRLGLGGQVGGPLETTLVLALSFLVGMEAPGEAALFARASISFRPVDLPPAGLRSLTYDLAVTEQDRRFGRIQAGVSFALDGTPIADAALDSFVRGPPVELDPARLRSLAPPSTRLAGKTALVVGGSRGLGAAIALCLADHGCRVVLNFAKSRASAERVASSAPAGAIELLEADASDGAKFADALRAVPAHEDIDVLVCSASPPLAALAIDGASAARLVDFVARSVTMVAAPLASSIETLRRRRGCLVLASTTAVTAPPRDWPHYVTAKAAVEGLAGAAIAAAPGLRALVVRPPLLRTDFVSRLGESADAMEPELVAANVVRALFDPWEGLRVLDRFDP